MAIVVGGEALIDLVPHAVGELRAHAGGGPYNTARTLGRLEQDVHYLGCLNELAQNSIAAAFGTGLATATQAATATPLPTTLAGTMVKVNGQSAPLFFVSPEQVNYVIPAGIPSGVASVVITSGDGTVATGTVQIAPVAPALFTANSSGQGPLAALLLRVKADGMQEWESLVRFDETSKSFVTQPFNLGEESDRLFLVLFLTGVRHAGASGVRVSIGGVESAPSYVGPQGTYTGLDQINVELPHSFSGRGRISLLVKAAGADASKPGEFEIGAGTTLAANAPIQIRGIDHDPALAGERIEISGSGFAANPRENTVQIVGDDGVTAKAEVLAVSADRLHVLLPFGVGTGNLKVSRGQSEASIPIRIRTSVSGFVENTQRQRLAGVKVFIPGTSVSDMTDENGSFVLAKVTPTEAAIFEVDARGIPGYDRLSPKSPVKANRDNQYPDPITLQQIKLPDARIVANGSSLKAALRLSDELPAEHGAAVGADTIQNGGINFELPSGATIQCPDGAGNCAISLTPVEKSRVPVSLPVSHFSSTIVQLAPFGAKFTPGGKLTFPNADDIPADRQATLFKLDQTPGSATRGTFVSIGTATVTAGGRRVETPANAITEGTYYFVSIERPLAAINGRVLESDARAVPRAIVRVRGQSTFTDGHGGFVLRSVPVVRQSGDKVQVEVSFQRPDGRISRKDGSEVELPPGGLATVTPEIVLDPVTTNFLPVILAPTGLTLQAGETREFDFAVADPDGDQPVQVTAAGPPFTRPPVSQGGNVWRMRLEDVNPPGSYKVDLTASDSQTQIMQSILITVNPASSVPVAQAQSVVTMEDTPRAIALTGHDAGGRPLTYALVTGPTRGCFIGSAPNTCLSNPPDTSALVYKPAPDFNGADSFTFKVSNGSAESQPATVFIAVVPVNDRPQLHVPGPQMVNAGQPLSLTVSATDVDGEQELEFAATGLPPGANFIKQSRQLIWTPLIEQAGDYSVEFKVADRGGLSDTQVVNITVSAKWARTTGPIGGDVRSFLSTGGTLYAGTHGGGIYRSLDAGRSWAESSEGLSGQSLFVLDLLAYGPALLAATREGVFRSTDDGRSWTAFREGLTGNGLLGSGLLIYQNSVYLGTDGGGVFRLNNDEQRWAAINDGLKDERLPDDGLKVNALLGRGTGLYAGVYGGGVLRLKDDGRSWERLNGGLAGLDLYIMSLAANGTSLVAGTFSHSLFRLNDGEQNWRPVNAGLPSNELRINALLSSGASLYAGTYGQGIYRSTNGAQSWEPFNNGLTGAAVYVNKLFTDGANLYAGTLEGVSRFIEDGRRWNRSNAGIAASSVPALLQHPSGLYAGTSGGVFRTTDDGLSWLSLNNGLAGDSLRVSALEASGDSLFAGTSSGGIYRSDDLGQNWVAQNNGLAGPGLSIYTLLTSGANLYAGTNGGGVYQLSNGEATWKRISCDLPPSPIIFALLANETDLYAGVFGKGVWRLASSSQCWQAASGNLQGEGLNVLALAAFGPHLYAGTRGGIYRSTDKGQNWVPFNDGLTGDGLFILELLVSGNQLYAGTRAGVYRLSADGRRWLQYGSALTNRDALALAASGERLFVGTDGSGVSVLAGSLQTWSESNSGLPNRFINALAADGMNLYAGSLGSGIFRSSDQGQSWVSEGRGLPPNANIQSIVTDGSTLWAAVFEQGVYRSNDQGASWTPVNANLTNRLINELFLNGAILYAGTDGGVFRSTDGASWTPLSSGLTNQRTVSFTITNGVLYAGTDGGGVFRLNGDLWLPVNQGLSGLEVTALGVHDAILYAGTRGGGIHVSRDGGENWTAVNNQLPPTLDVFAFGVSGRKVYAGSVYGVFVTEDEGQSWKQINAGLVNTFVTGMVVSGQTLFAGTLQGGVFVSRMPQQ